MKSYKYYSILILILPVWLAASQQGGLFSASGLDLEELFFARYENPFTHSTFSEVDSLNRIRVNASTRILPTLESEGDRRVNVSSSSHSGQLLVGLIPNQLAFGMGVHFSHWRHNFENTKDWDFYWQDQKKQLPVSLFVSPKFDAWFHSQLKLESDFSGQLKKSALRIQGDNSWVVEFQASVEETQEDISLSESSDSVVDFWKAQYLSQRRNFGISTVIPIPFGKFETNIEYHQSLPLVNQSEYQFSDSSQSILLGVKWQTPWYGSLLRWDFSESQSYTFGRRYPPNTLSVRRFHYALGHGYFSRLEIAGGIGNQNQRMGRLRLGITHRFYRYRNSPHPNALNERKQTLSYNRLESSYLNTIWGGFLQSSELSAVFLDIHRTEAKVEWQLKTGNVQWEVALPTAWVDLYGRAHSTQVTEHLLYLTIDRVVFREIQGPMLWMSPSLALSHSNGPIRISMRVSHAFVVWEQLKDGEGTRFSGGISSQTSGLHYPFFGNGALFEGKVSYNF